MTELELYDEQEVLACLLWHPQQHAFELAEIRPEMFRVRVHQQIAHVLCGLRDSGVRVHWRRVRRILRAARLFEAAGFIEPMIASIGSSVFVHVPLANLIYRAAHPATRAARTEAA